MRMKRALELANTYFRGAIRPFFIYLIIPSIFLSIYYLYLNNLYLVDEILEVSGPRELKLDERFTIRTISPENSIHLKKFIEKYSLCPSVFEIQVIWFSPTPPPKQEDFIYTATHSKVSFEPKSKVNPIGMKPDLSIQTEGVLLLDPGIDLSCSALAFLHSSWRSSKQIVGLLPRLHQTKDLPSSLPAPSSSSSTSSLLSQKNLEYRGWEYVWWNRAYSLLLSDALLLGAKDLDDMASSPVLEDILSSTSSSLSPTQRRACESLLPSLWLAAQGRGPNPWVDVPYSFSPIPTLRSFLKQSSSQNSNQPSSSSTSSSLTLPSHQEMTYCLNELVKILNVKDLPISRYKSIPATNSLFW